VSGIPDKTFELCKLLYIPFTAFPARASFEKIIAGVNESSGATSNEFSQPDSASIDKTTRRVFIFFIISLF
jgi:hypothetical protein